jgi:hypothetical protein
MSNHAQSSAPRIRHERPLRRRRGSRAAGWALCAICALHAIAITAGAKADTPAPPEADEPAAGLGEAVPLDLPTFAPVVAGQTYDARIIQALLDQQGFCQLPPGTHVINEPIYVRHNQRLTGCGRASVLKFTGQGDWAIQFGDEKVANYACYLDNFAVSGGGIWCRRFGQHCGIDRVWISEAPRDGLRIEGVGDKFLVRDVVAYGNKGHGIAIRSPVTNNGITLDHCNAQGNGGHGLLFETTTWGGTLAKAVIRDCTIQGNGHGGRVKAEVMVRGWVQLLRLENIWIESPQGKSTSLPVGIRVEASEPFQNPKSGDEKNTRRPSGFLITGNSAIHLVPRAIEFAHCLNIRIDQLSLAPRTARIYWRSNPAGGDWTHTKKPRGDMWMLDESRLVADPTLGD